MDLKQLIIKSDTNKLYNVWRVAYLWLTKQLLYKQLYYYKHFYSCYL